MRDILACITLVATFARIMAAPANLPKRASGKAGISWPQQERTAKPLEKFFGKGSALTFHWDWNKNYGTDLFTYDTEKANIDAEFVPMQYDTAMLFNSDPLEEGWTEMMGYNEPDLFSANGVSSPMSVNVAGDNWKILVKTIRGIKPDAILWSPAVAGSRDWLSQFFNYICPSGLHGCEYAPDYLAIHVYALTMDSFQSQVNNYHDEFGLDIVITEYACYFWDGSDPQPSQETVSAFMADSTAWLDAQPWIHKYAWFGAVKDSLWLWGVAETNRLMDTSGELTDLGRQYIGGGGR